MSLQDSRKIGNVKIVMLKGEKGEQGDISEAQMNAAIQEAVGAEETARQQMDASLQSQINNLNSNKASIVALLDETIARQNADTTLQNNINSEASARTNADSTINARIDQLIAPSGEAPSSAEILDARVGADGVIYPSLGAAIRTQFENANTKLHEALNYVDIESNNGNDIVSSYVNGTYSNTLVDGFIEFNSNTNRIRPDGIIKVQSGDSVIIRNGSSFSHVYTIWENLNGNAKIISTSSSFTALDEILEINKDGFLTVAFANTQDVTITIDPTQFDGEIIINHVYNIDYKRLNKGYLDDIPLFKDSVINSAGQKIYDPNRLSTLLRPIKKGGKIKVNSGSLKFYIRIWSDNDLVNPYRNDGAWHTGIEETTVFENSHYVIVFAQNDNTQPIEYNDFDGYINEIYPIKNNANSIELGTLNNCYIATGIGNIGDIVNMTPISYTGFGCCISECTKGDLFVIKGIGGGSGRLWAFLDVNYELISRANSSEMVGENINIFAPENAAYFVGCYDINYEYKFTLFKNYAIFPTKIIDATIDNMPTAIVKPVITYQAPIANDDISRVKGSIFKNNDYYCVVYNENLDGNTDDYPQVDGTGGLAIKYKFFKLENGVESEVDYDVIAQKGDNYIDWNNNEATFVGGVGLPSAVNNKQYFTAAFTGQHNYNGFTNYGMTPCCVDVTISSSGVTIGTIRELSLTINGIKGAFDVYRIDENNENYYIYYTTTPPTIGSDNKWYWTQPVKNGIALFISDNGIDWTYIRTITTEYQPACEVTSLYVDSQHSLFAARTWTDNAMIDPDAIVGVINRNTGELTCQYRFNCKTTRVYLARDIYGCFMLYNPRSYRECTCIRIDFDGLYHLLFEKWFSIYHNTTWYNSIELESLMSLEYPNMYIVGSNGNVSENDGMTFTVLNIDSSPRIINQINASVE